jgi:hypothetical protein
LGALLIGEVMVALEKKEFMVVCFLELLDEEVEVDLDLGGAMVRYPSKRT